ncbi:unnamed protein product [Rhizoctonia solani]|uniref:Uncharacterized protein n=1 Tax=Rhizoctonia solani TaxID=456999 RepID=A0A8H3BXX7_9AGAM|nr:unnamed protein product [Rhizoctonia solani]
MQLGDTHEIYSGTHLPMIPDDVTHLIAHFSSFEVLASLVRCNKSLHRSCTPLLFREIRLHKPMQLIKLCRNREALNRLSETKSMFLEESLFFPYCWGDAWTGVEPAAHYFITAFRAATSLLRLQIFAAPAPNIVSDNLITKLRSMSSDPTEIGVLIRESKGNLLVKYSYLHFIVRFPEAIRNKGDAPISNLLAWLQEVFQEANLSADSIKCLYITFEPSPLRMSTLEQHTIITKISKLLPTLKHAQFSLIIWNRYDSSLEGSQDSLPLWTPEPKCFSIGWWLDTLHIRPTSTKTQEEAEQIAMQLREGMRRRYPPGKIPPVDFLVKHVLSLNKYI